MIENKFLVRWKVVPCFSGAECWCRMIVPENSTDDDEYIVPGASLNRETAEYLVELHNEELIRTKKSKK